MMSEIVFLFKLGGGWKLGTTPGAGVDSRCTMVLSATLGGYEVLHATLPSVYELAIYTTSMFLFVLSIVHLSEAIFGRAHRSCNETNQQNLW